MNAIDAWQFLWLLVLTVAVLAAFITDWDDVLGHPRYGPRRYQGPRKKDGDDV